MLLRSLIFFINNLCGFPRSEFPAKMRGPKRESETKEVIVIVVVEMTVIGTGVKGGSADIAMMKGEKGGIGTGQALRTLPVELFILRRHYF